VKFRAKLLPMRYPAGHSADTRTLLVSKCWWFRRFRPRGAADCQSVVRPSAWSHIRLRRQPPPACLAAGKLAAAAGASNRWKARASGIALRTFGRGPLYYFGASVGEAIGAALSWCLGCIVR
jgi:hypothetical protein